MLHERLRNGHVVVEGDDLVEDRRIAGLTDIGTGAGDEPERVIVEAGTDIGIALLGEGLVLMIGGAVLVLRGGDVDDALPRTVRDQMDKAQKILTGITEAHAAADAGLIIGGGTAHVKGDHALVLIPDIRHAV